MKPSSGLRIGLVCPYSFDTPGGVQNHVLGLARHLHEHGHQPHILAPGEVPVTDSTAIDSLGADSTGAGRNAARAGTTDRLLIVGSRFTSAGAAVPVRYNGSVARVNFGPLSAARVRRWLRDQSFDVVHIHEPVTPSIGMLALWAADVPVVATFHTATPRSRTMQLAGGTLSAAIEKITAGIAVSESARQVVVQHLGRDAVVIPNGFRFEDFGVGGPYGRWRGGRRPRLSFLGRLNEPRKGLDVLLAALPTIRAGYPDLDVVVAGQGDRRLPPGCRAVGMISDRQRAGLLATTDVFVAPHLARESFGIVLLEAMASGAPVVASDLDAFADILTAHPVTGEGPLGATYPAGDSEALAAVVARVLASPDQDQVAAARRASRRYDWGVVGSAVTEVYHAAIALGTRQVNARGAGR